jgi:hypothetical protein
VLIDGAMADGGGDFTVVSDLELEFVVLLDVDSVTIACANTETVAVIIKIAANFFNIFSYLSCSCNMTKPQKKIIYYKLLFRRKKRETEVSPL